MLVPLRFFSAGYGPAFNANQLRYLITSDNNRTTKSRNNIYTDIITHILRSLQHTLKQSATDLYTSVMINNSLSSNTHSRGPGKT